MNKERSRIGSAVSAVTRAGEASASRTARLGLTAALGASLALCGPDAPRAQQQQRWREPEVTVTAINSGGGTVSITADGSLNRAQTWQDTEGFHVMLPNGRTALGGSARGVKVRRVGNSLELVVPVSPGAGVTVRPRGDRLDLVMSGERTAPLPEAIVERQGRPAARQQARDAAPAEPARPAPARRQEFEAAPAAELPRPRPQRPEQPEPSAEAGALAGAAPKSAPPPVQQPAPAGAGGDLPPAPQPAEAQAPPAEVAAAPVSMRVGESLGSLIFSLPALLLMLGLAVAGALAAFVLRRRRAGRGAGADAPAAGSKKSKEPSAKKAAAKKEQPKESSEDAGDVPFEQSKGDRRKSKVSVPIERRRSGVGAEDQASRELRGLDGRPAEPANPALPAVQFGAYRIDHEVSLLVQGLPHSVEVISSRAPDDRRALSTSLLKALRAPETDEDGRRRARMALEDYGFVARECASLLLGAESFDRASAARALGEMRSAQALPFLTESLYDADPVVRVASVQSLGELGLPSAIGALLHTAHRHPEIPASVICPALTACSVESLELPWEPAHESGPAEGGEFAEEFAGEVRALAPVSGYEELPDWVEDETLTLALAGSESEDAGARAHAAQALAQFQVRRAVEALAGMATLDAEASVRAAAVTSLGLINHESVFVPVVVAMADGAREVRAAAARALSRLSFDRAEAYIRVFETADARTLSEVARACVSTGLAAQAINRLASQDRRQSYEAYSLLSLAVKAGEVQPLVDAVECHRDTDVRLACVGLLGQAREEGLAECFRHLAESASVPERVRAALREAAGRDRQPV